MQHASVRSTYHSRADFWRHRLPRFMDDRPSNLQYLVALGDMWCGKVASWSFRPSQLPPM